MAPVDAPRFLAALPTAASASPLLTENGVAVPVGATVQATSIGIPLRTTSIGSDECKRSVMHGNVTANTGSQISIEVSSFYLECVSSSGFFTMQGQGLPWCWKTTKSDSFELRGGKCSEAAKSLTLLWSTESTSCSFTRTALTGTFKTSPEEAVMTLLDQEFAVESGFCQPFKLDINYSMETAISPFTTLTIS
ncbi:MAG TPA: hypothetical protein VGK66_05620 [Solirubrobacterales bacterium]